ncbi:unnamed protein product [Auanema sp. JU1783]|nr:unnamed protein product [Auanema sp. JU1783]
MRASLILGLALTVFFFDAAHGQNKATFNTKLNKICTAFLAVSDMGKVSDKIFKDVYDEKPMKNISANSMGYLTSACPITKYGTLMSLMSKNDNCLKAAGVKERTLDVVGQLGEILSEMLKKPYNQLKTKAVACKKNKAAEDKCINEMYKIGTSCATKDLIQKIVTKCANTMKCPIWGCAIENVTALIKLNEYNTTRTKKC